MGISEFQKMQERAVKIRAKYSEKDTKEWDVEQVFMGMVKDVGDLSKLLMLYRGYRNDSDKDIRKRWDMNWPTFYFVFL